MSAVDIAEENVENVTEKHKLADENEEQGEKSEEGQLNKEEKTIDVNENKSKEGNVAYSTTQGTNEPKSEVDEIISEGNDNENITNANEDATDNNASAGNNSAENAVADNKNVKISSVQDIARDDGEKASHENNEEEAADDVPKVVDDLVSKIDDVPMCNPELEQLDANLTPPLPSMSGEEFGKENQDIENNSNFGECEINDNDFAKYDREQLLQQYKESLEDRVRIQQMSQQYQHKLAEYFKKKKSDDKAQEMDKNVTDQEQRYLKYMSNLEELQASEARQASSIEMQLEELKGKCQEKQNKVEEASVSFMNFKYEIAKNSINSRTGKAIPQKDLEQYQLAEQKKENEVITVRLENIKLKNRLKKRELQLKAKEELAEGLHLIDFEQLKIENQTYNEKIEERNEELLKLRKKINSTVQVLTHLKEKLQHVQGENGEQRTHLRDIDATVAKKRDLLTRLKQSRDSLRFDNSKLKHKAGLLGNKPLLRDFEVRKDESEVLRDRLTELKEHHLELNLTLNGIRKKIECTKDTR